MATNLCIYSPVNITFYCTQLGVVNLFNLKVKVMQGH